MQQLALRVVSRLPYSVENFVSHAGITEIVAGVQYALNADQFSLFLICGAPRSGKTHLAVALSEYAGAAGRYPYLTSGRELIEGEALLIGDAVHPVVIVDEAQTLFAHTLSSNSGIFVDLVERVRLARGVLILLATVHPEDLACDDHVLSRIRAGSCFTIGQATEVEFNKILKRMAEQRGIRLDQRKLDFLTKRLPHEISSIDEYLTRLDYLAKLFGAPIKQKLVADAL